MPKTLTNDEVELDRVLALLPKWNKFDHFVSVVATDGTRLFPVDADAVRYMLSVPLEMLPLLLASVSSLKAHSHLFHAIFSDEYAATVVMPFLRARLVAQ